MIRAILWKEWHEHRARYAAFWLTLSAPVLILCSAIALSHTARVPFADLSDATIWRYLPFSLAISILLVTVFTGIAAYLAVATLNPEIADHSLFYMFEQPFGRRRYAAIKLLNGGLHVVAATFFAMMLSPSIIYALMLLSGRVTIAGSGAVYAAVMAGALRGSVWCSLAMLGGFTLSAIVAASVRRWWLAVSVSLTVLTLIGVFAPDSFYDFSPDCSAGTMSVSVNSAAQWLNISRAVTPAELAGFARWKPWPLLFVAGLVVVFSVATVLLYERKELK
jgi:hypothetical protein